MPKRKTVKTVKEKYRAAILSDVAKIFCYWDYPELAQFHARNVVAKLTEWKLLNPVLPLRPIDTKPPGM